MKTIRAGSVLPILALLLLPTLLLWRVVFGGEVFLPADLLRDIAPWHSPDQTHIVPWNPLLWDGIAEFYPWRLFAAESLRHGWIPLWNPHQLCGTPFVANSQSAVFYPLNLLFVVLPVARAFGVSVWLHLALTGLFLYGYLRSPAWRLSAPSALLGAASWQMSAWQVSWLALPTFLCVSCWLPLALWLAWQAVSPSQNNLAKWAALGVCLGVMILAGHLQIALYCLALVSVYTLFLLVSSPPGTQFWGRQIVGIVLAIGLMIGLAAPQFLPAIELARVSHRAGATATWHSYSFYVALAVPVSNLITLWLPGFYGNPTQGTYWGAVANGGPSAYMENACYVGLLALGLAFVGVGIGWKTSQQTRFFAIAAIIALLMALGTPLDALFYFGLPGFSQSASPGRILVLWTLCAAILAATGLESILKAEVSRRAALTIGAVFLGVSVLVIGGTLLWIAQHGPQGVLAFNLPRVGDLWRVPLGLVVGAGALLWLRRRGTLAGGPLGFGIACLTALDLLAAGMGYNHTTTLSEVYPTTPAITYLQTHLGTDRVLILNHEWSLDALHPPNALMPPNTATVSGLNDIAGYDSLLTRRSLRFVASVDDGQDPAPPENGNMMFTRDYATEAAQEADARYVASSTPLTDPALTLVAQSREIFVYQNRRAFARARTATGLGDVQLQDVAPTRVDVEVTGDSGGRLIVADQWTSGWRAFVNGKPTPVSLSQGMWQQITLTPHQEAHVQMRYLPTTFRVGLYAFCLAFGTILGLCVAYGLGRRRQR
jgi:hypothetical protein